MAHELDDSSMAEVEDVEEDGSSGLEDEDFWR